MSKKVYCDGDWCGWSTYIILKNASGSKKTKAQILRELGWRYMGLLNGWWCPKCVATKQEKEDQHTVEY